MKANHSSPRKRMMLSSLAMLLIATLTLGMATYAWFSMSKTTEVTGLNFTAEAANGIQISTDGVNWKTALTANDIQSAQSLQALKPASTNGKVTAGALSFFGLDANGKNVVAASPVTTTADGGYFAFDFYVLNQMGADTTFQLNLADSTVTAGTGDKGTENAVRVAFIQQNSSTTVDTATNGGTTATIWEPNATTHTTFATNTRRAPGADGIVTDTALVKNGTAYSYLGLNAAFAGPDLTTGAVNNTTHAAKVTTVTDTTGVSALGTMTQDCITKYTCYIWIEGQDVDCANDVASGKFDVALKFSLPENNG